jgi:hypothetical protein
MTDELDGVISETGIVRRTFMRRLVTGTVFAAPVVASFAMGGIEAASSAASERSAGVPLGNANQTETSLFGEPCDPGRAPFGNANQTVMISNANQHGFLSPFQAILQYCGIGRP